MHANWSEGAKQSLCFDLHWIYLGERAFAKRMAMPSGFRFTCPRFMDQGINADPLQGAVFSRG